MELRQLTYFVAVAEELHFGRAAMRVCIAQPALSTQVQALERHLGVQLFHRTTRRVELTRAGQVFYDRCIQILGDINLSTEMARCADGKGSREIRIGTIYPFNIGVWQRLFRYDRRTNAPPAISRSRGRNNRHADLGFLPERMGGGRGELTATSAKSSRTSTARIVVSASSADTVTFSWPRSILPTYDRSMFASKARRSWEYPFSTRSLRRFQPM